MARRLALVVVALAVVVAGCGTSQYEYVKNRDKGLYFRIPKTWGTVRVRGATRPDPAYPEQPWVLLVDAASKPSVDHYQEDLPTHPVGIAEVGPAVARRDDISLSFLRSLSLGGQADPLKLVEEGSDLIELISHRRLATKSGLRGVEVAFNLRADNGKFLTVEQVALVNNDTSRLYRLIIKCESSCFRANKHEIDRVIDSWTVKDKT